MSTEFTICRTYSASPAEVQKAWDKLRDIKPEHDLELPKLTIALEETGGKTELMLTVRYKTNAEYAPIIEESFGNELDELQQLLTPFDYHLTRVITNHAKLSHFFSLVNNSYYWREWAIWTKSLPESAINFAGPGAGEGATMSWEGGNWEILESVDDKRIKIQMEFSKPFKAIFISKFTFMPYGNQTRFTWAISGATDFPSKDFAAEEFTKQIDECVITLGKLSLS